MVCSYIILHKEIYNNILQKKWQKICSTADLPVLGLALGWGGGGGGGDSVSGLTTVIDPYIATVSVLYHPFKINPSVGTL